MPVTYGTFTKQLKLLPLVLHDTGSASITVRFGYVGDDGVFTATTSDTFNIPESDVSLILDAPPMNGLTRRNDLSLAVYQYLVLNGLVPQGEIS